MGMHKRRTDLNLKNSMHVDLHNEQEAQPEMKSAVGAHKLKVKPTGMSTQKEAEFKADVLPPTHMRGASSGITSATQSISARRHGGPANSIKSS